MSDADSKRVDRTTIAAVVVCVVLLVARAFGSVPNLFGMTIDQAEWWMVVLGASCTVAILFGLVAQEVFCPKWPWVMSVFGVTSCICIIAALYFFLLAGQLAK